MNMQSSKTSNLILVLALSLAATTEAHGYLTVPPARHAVHDVGIDPKTTGADGYSTVIFGPAVTDLSSNNGALPAGAAGKAKAAAVGHGLCGDDGPRSLFTSGEFGATAPTATWVEGATVDLQVTLTAHHLGWFEFRLCDGDLSQACLNEHVLEFDAAYTRGLFDASDYGGDRSDAADYWGDRASYRNVHTQCEALQELDEAGSVAAGVADGTCCSNGGACSDPEHNTDRFMVPNYSPVYDLKYKLPAGVTCDACVLQFAYVTGNSVDNYPEVFWNCADVRIVANNSPMPEPTMSGTDDDAADDDDADDDDDVADDGNDDGTECSCVSIVDHISDAWCMGVKCDAVYSAFCQIQCEDEDEDKDSSSPTPRPTTVTTPPNPTQRPTPRPTPTAPTVEPTASGDDDDETEGDADDADDDSGNDGTECSCVSIVDHISDAWCMGVKCDAVYSAFCQIQCEDEDEDKDSSSPTPRPTTVTTPPNPTQRPTPRPTPTAPTVKPTASGDGGDDEAKCGCVSIVAHISDAWCEGVACDAAYSAFCQLTECGGDDDATPTPTAVVTTQPTAGPTPRPWVDPMRPTARPTAAPTPRPSFSAEPTSTAAGYDVVAGYVENWRSISDTARLDSLTTVLYSFLTLDIRPNPDEPRDVQWDGVAIYDSMAAADILEVMDATEPLWANPHNWQRVKIAALMDYCKAQGKKFLWAFGGWSDLKRTIADDQVDLLVAQLVALLELGGDGIDFDWEHLSAASDPMLLAQQRLIVGKVVVALKDQLVLNGMANKLITYTPRYNAFWDSGAYGSGAFQTDGEGIDVVSYIAANSIYGVDALDYVHFMMYDIDAKESFPGAAESYFVDAHYDAVLDASLQYIPADKIVMGFEPGPQAYTGVWGGLEHDQSTIARLASKIGGVFFWAMNEGAVGANGKTNGENSATLAAFAAGLEE